MNLRQNQEDELRARQDTYTAADWDTVPERVSETEMREVMELYDTQSGLAPTKTPTQGSSQANAASEASTNQAMPTISDVAEILGISNAEAQRLLAEVRARKQAEQAEKEAEAARQRERRLPPLPPQTRQGTYTTQTTVTPPTLGQTTVTLQPAQQVTVVQNVIVDSHAYLFEKFNANGGNFVATWNWGAFWFNWWWYFYKGMWAKGLLYMFALPFVVGLTGGAGFLPFLIFMGIMGNYDYYLLRVHRTQMWDKKPSAYLPTTTVVHSSSAAEAGYRAAQSFRTTPPVTPQQTQTPPTQAPQMQTPQMQTTTPATEAVSPAGKFQVLREAYERGLVTRAEYEEKRLVLLRELENQDNLKKLDEAHRLGILTADEYETKRNQLLNGQ